jgi:hypothetical protein
LNCACSGSCEAFAFDLCIQQWATYLQAFTWLSPQVGANGSQQQLPVDLTGYTATLQIRPYPQATTILYDASSNITFGGPTGDPTTGIITITIPASVTAGFTWWSGVYDLLLTNLAGTVTRFTQGNVTVSAGVST